MLAILSLAGRDWWREGGRFLEFIGGMWIWIESVILEIVIATVDLFVCVERGDEERFGVMLRLRFCQGEEIVFERWVFEGWIGLFLERVDATIRNV